MSELNKWEAVRDEYITIDQFLEWMSSIGIDLDFSEVRQEDFPTIDSRTPDRLLMRYLEISKRQLEKERSELLTEARHLTAARHGCT